MQICPTAAPRSLMFVANGGGFERSIDDRSCSADRLRRTFVARPARRTAPHYCIPLDCGVPSKAESIKGGEKGGRATTIPQREIIYRRHRRLPALAPVRCSGLERRGPALGMYDDHIIVRRRRVYFQRPPSSTRCILCVASCKCRGMFWRICLQCSRERLRRGERVALVGLERAHLRLERGAQPAQLLEPRVDVRARRDARLLFV